MRAALSSWLLGGGSEELDLSVPHPKARRLLASTSHLEAMRAHTPELLEEMAGIAAGAGVALENVQAFCLMDEEWAAVGAGGSGPGCTVVCARRGKTSLLAQTMDLPVHYSGSWLTLNTQPEKGGPQAVLELKPCDGGRHAVVFTCAGMLGLLGCNSDGLTVCLNNLATVANNRSGLPVAAVLRGLLRNCANVPSAAAYLRSLPHATGQAYTIGDAYGELACIEASACRVASVPIVLGIPGAEEGWAHANHPLVLPISGGMSESEAERTYGRSASRERQTAAASAVKGADSLAALEAALAVPPVAKTLQAARERGGGSCTFAAVSFVCGHRWGPQRMRVACGAPSESEEQHGFVDTISEWVPIDAEV